jgi:dephospho-CoA kinase
MQRQMHVLAEEDPSAMIILDIPLLYESGSQRVLPIEEVIVVYIPRHMQLLRLMGRDGLSQEEAEKRIHAQMSIEDKRKLADIVIDNSGTPNETWLQVQSYLKKKGKL